MYFCVFVFCVCCFFLVFVLFLVFGFGFCLFLFVFVLFVFLFLFLFVFLCLTIHIATALHSVCADVTRHHPCARHKLSRWTQIHGKHGSGARLVGLRIWNERGARRNECETRCSLTLERVRNSLLESFRSRRFSLVAGCDAKVTNCTDPLTLNPWLWRANRLNHSGRCSASFTVTGECSDESERCT